MSEGELPQPEIPPVSELPPAVVTPVELPGVVVVRTTVEGKVQLSEEENRTFTEEASKKHAGQRFINSIWEFVQATIALSVVWTGIGVSAVLALRLDDSEPVRAAAVGALLFLTGAGNLVIGFYFGRTNHQRVGGVGGDLEKSSR